MLDMEILLARVWNADTRPLAEEALRCYNAGTVRASIAATWTAITADLISKLVQLAEDGDAGAVAFRTEVAAAQERGVSPEGVRAMQTIESSLLAKAAQFELIDSISRRELERIREDRNLCVHPSLRSFGETYEPLPEVARGHLAVALMTLLIHPPTQGARVIEAFQDYTCDPSFVPAVAHIQTTFFDQVRTATRANIARVAAKHGLRELDPDGRLPAAEYANRSAIVLYAFAQRDRALVASAIATQRAQFQQLEGEVQLRAMIRLGDQDFFWAIVDDALAERFHHLLNTPVPVPQGDPLPFDFASRLAMVRSPDARARLPILEQRFEQLDTLHKMNVVAMFPSPYFVSAVHGFLSEAWSYRVGEQAGHLLVQHAPFLTADTLDEALTRWAANSQCREAAQMPELALALFRSTAHLGPAQAKTFATFLATVQHHAREGDSYYRYPSLEAALRAAGHVA